MTALRDLVCGRAGFGADACVLLDRVEQFVSSPRIGIAARGRR
jgi:hypothetical protein